MALLTSRLTGHLQMKLLRRPVRIVAEDTFSEDFIVVGVTGCKGPLLVAGEACFSNRGLLEFSRVLARVTVLTFCLGRMRSVSLPAWRSVLAPGSCDSKLDPLE